MSHSFFVFSIHTATIKNHIYSKLSVSVRPFTPVMSVFVVETALLRGLIQVTVNLVNLCLRFCWTNTTKKKVGKDLILSLRTWETLKGKQYILSYSLARWVQTR